LLAARLIRQQLIEKTAVAFEQWIAESDVRLLGVGKSELAQRAGFRLKENRRSRSSITTSMSVPIKPSPASGRGEGEAMKTKDNLMHLGRLQEQVRLMHAAPRCSALSKRSRKTSGARRELGKCVNRARSVFARAVGTAGTSTIWRTGWRFQPVTTTAMIPAAT
jgi:hypothetical protein